MTDVEASSFSSANNGIDCQIFVHPSKYPAFSTSSFVFQKDFALKEIIDYQLQKFWQSGLMSHLAKKYFKKINQECDVPMKELSFKATFMSFVLLVFGLVLAIICFVLEKFRFRHFK